MVFIVFMARAPCLFAVRATRVAGTDTLDHIDLTMLSPTDWLLMPLDAPRHLEMRPGDIYTEYVAAHPDEACMPRADVAFFLGWRVERAVAEARLRRDN
jgi:hypothetical protein